MYNQDFTEPPNINILNTTVDCCGHYILGLSYILDKKRRHFPHIDHEKEDTSATKKKKFKNRTHKYLQFYEIKVLVNASLTVT